MILTTKNISFYSIPGIDRHLKKKIVNIRKISIEEVLDVVSKKMDLTVEEIKSKSQKRECVDARHLIGYICTNELKLTFTQQQVSDFFKKRNHSIIIHGNKKIRNLIRTDKSFNLLVTSVFNALEI